MLNRDDLILASLIHHRSNSELAEKISSSNKQVVECLKRMTNDEIEARDRVDISLNTYKKMVERLNYLESEVVYYHSVLENLGIPPNVQPDPNSIKIYYDEDVINCRKKCVIHFTYKKEG